MWASLYRLDLSEAKTSLKGTPSFGILFQISTFINQFGAARRFVLWRRYQARARMVTIKSE